MTRLNTRTLAGLLAAIAVIAILVGLTGGAISDTLTAQPDRTHAEIAATLDGGNLSLHVTDPNDAERVTVAVAEGYPVSPSDERRAANISFRDGTLVFTNVSVALGPNTTVIVRSHASNGEILVTNVYRRHADTGELVDMYGGYDAYHRSLNPAATLGVERVNNTTYLVTWHLPTPGFRSATQSDVFHPGISRADNITLYHDEIYADDGIELDHVGDSARIEFGTKTTDWNETYPTKWTVVGEWNGKKTVLATIDEEDLTACGLDDPEFDAEGEEFALAHCTTDSE